MATMIIRSILALFVCASLAACSANKDSSAPVHMGTNAKTQGQPQTKDENGRQPSPNSTTNTTTTSNGQNVQTVDGTDSNANSSDSSKDTSNSKTDKKVAAKSSSSSTSSSTSGTTSTSKARPVVKSESSTQQKAATSPSSATTSQTQTQTQSKSQEQKKQGQDKSKSEVSSKELRKMKDEASRYTGSADDYLRNYLLSKENSLPEAQQAANLKMANAVQSASLGIDYDSEDGTGSGDVIVRLNVLIKGKETSVTLAGNLDNDKLKTRLQVTGGNSKLKGELICMDRNNGLNRPTCETAVADIRGSSGASVKIIFRRTNQDFQEHFNMKMCTSNECYDLYSMFTETHGYQQGYIKGMDDLTLEKTKMESFEVINGRAAFRVLMLTAGDISQVNQQRINKQLIVFGGPLYNQDILSSAQPMVAADRKINPEDQMNYRTGANYKTELNRTMKDIRITTNDGFGKISALITIGSKDPNLTEQFQLDITRKTAELRPMENMQLK